MNAKRNSSKNPLKGLGLLLLASSFLLGSVSAQEPVVDEVRSGTQDFNLFKSVNTGSGADRLRDSSRGRRQGNARAAEPEFTLIGTSRIGNKYSAILRNKDGREIVIDTSADTNTRIEGYSQFSIVNINAGRVAIQYPQSTSCVEYEDKGVSCNSGANIASLALTNGAPIQRRASRSSGTNRGRRENAEDELANLISSAEEDGEVIVSVEEIDAPTNPFAALRARAQANGGISTATSANTQQRQSFTPRRIDPADVPPGMRVVSTPFGDRLIEQDR